MKTPGVYYQPNRNVFWYVERVDYYEDLVNPAFSIVWGYVDNKTVTKCLITKTQFKLFKRIGEL